MLAGKALVPLQLPARQPGSFECRCSNGFITSGTACTGTNECETDAHNCAPDAECTDTDSSFTCTCVEGRWICVLRYRRVRARELSERHHRRVHQHGRVVLLFVCCRVLRNGLFCEDVDECATELACSDRATCANTIGSFTCSCSDGYYGDGAACNDINECRARTANCDTKAVCSNIPGSFQCTCNAGYGGDGVTCSDVDECTQIGTDPRCTFCSNIHDPVCGSNGKQYPNACYSCL